MSANPRGPMMEALLELQKAVTAGTIEEIVPEALEEEAHNTLWRASSKNELTLLKLCPQRGTHSIEHKFDKVLSYGEDRGDGFFGEESLPLETEPEFDKVSTFIRLLGEHSSTFILAHLQKTVKVDGEVGADAIARSSLLKNLLKKKNRAMYFSDTRTQRSGADATRFEGLLQQIEEGTDGTNGTSPYGSHVIDFEGQPFTAANVRKYTAQVITLFGFLNCMIMDPWVRAELEASMDPAQMNLLPIGARPFMLGQNIGGMHTQGGDVFFHTDNTLTPLYSKPRYRHVAMRGAPGAPTASHTLNATATSPNVSKWFAADASTFFWMITEIRDGRESLGVRVPASGGQAVTVDNEVEFAITPNDPLSDTFAIYRGVNGQATTTAWKIFEVANDGGGAAVTAFDLNAYRPNCSTVFGLNIRSEASEYLHSAPTGLRDNYSLAVEESERFLTMSDNPQNTVTMVSLGPSMGVLELAAILATTSRPLLYSACAMQVRNPLQNIAFINVRSEMQPE
jgi:hypothetical protein